MMKNKSSVLVLVSTLVLSACTAVAVKYQFSKADEVNAESQAEWITITSTLDSNPVFYDPYQMYWLTPRTFSVPIRYASSGQYGNWVYKMNCDANQIEVVKTLGGKYLNKNIDPQSDNLLVLARKKLCGIQIKEKLYVFVGVDNNSLDYYFDAQSLARNKRISTRYKLTLLSFSASENRFVGKGDAEIDCADKTYKPGDAKQWTSTPRRSPANVLTDQICRDPYINRKLAGRTYTDQTTAPSDTNALDYINKLNEKPKSPVTSQSQGTKPTKSTSDFDWKSLVIQPKSN